MELTKEALEEARVHRRIAPGSRHLVDCDAGPDMCFAGLVAGPVGRRI